MKKRILSMLLVLAAAVGAAIPASARAAAKAPALPSALNAAWFKGRPSDRFDPDIALVAAYMNEKRGSFEEDYFAFQYRDEPPGKFFGLQTIHIGHMKSGKDTLVAVRLGTTTSQWGTVVMGYMVPWQYNVGYVAYADKAWSALEAHLEDLGADAKKTKLLITGHSAGGACANILGERLSREAIAGKRLDAKNIYIYTFESPGLYSAWSSGLSCAFPKGENRNIFNLVNTADAAAQILPGELLGTTLYFTCTQPVGTHAHALDYEDYVAGIPQAKEMERAWPRAWFSRDTWAGLMNMMAGG